MRPNESGTTRVSMSRTIASLNDLRIFVTRSSADSITFDTIRKSSKPCFIPFFKMDVELFMRTYIVKRTCRQDRPVHATTPAFNNREYLAGEQPAQPLANEVPGCRLKFFPGSRTAACRIVT